MRSFINAKSEKMFQEFKLNDKLTLRNRIVVAPMTTQGANDDLTFFDIEVEYYAARANGAAMFIQVPHFFNATAKVSKISFMQVAMPIFLL